jgi:hypothetical protein
VWIGNSIFASIAFQFQTSLCRWHVPSNGFGSAPFQTCQASCQPFLGSIPALHYRARLLSECTAGRWRLHINQCSESIESKAAQVPASVFTDLFCSLGIAPGVTPSDSCTMELLRESLPIASYGHIIYVSSVHMGTIALQLRPVKKIKDESVSQPQPLQSPRHYFGLLGAS